MFAQGTSNRRQARRAAAGFNNRMEHNAADARQFGYWFADSRFHFFAPHGSCGALGLKSRL
jgi:hypothetical protein